jgi:AcrR family transcriptional regulator
MATEAPDKKQQRRERQHAAIRDEVKAVARAHMARDGAAALSLRAVATDMGLSSAAIYYYFPNRDALITDLIVDSFRALGDAIRAADTPEADIAERVTQAGRAYRAWALAHPAEYALIFGPPIPGYQAPTETTAPEARSSLAAIGELLSAAAQQGRLAAPAVPLPPAVEAHVAAWAAETGQPAAPAVVVATLRLWAFGHGFVGLELDHQLQPVIGDTGPLFEYELARLLRELGVARA